MPRRVHGPTRGTLDQPTVARKPTTWFSDCAGSFAKNNRVPRPCLLVLDLSIVTSAMNRVGPPTREQHHHCITSHLHRTSSTANEGVCFRLCTRLSPTPKPPCLPVVHPSRVQLQLPELLACLTGQHATLVYKALRCMIGCAVRNNLEVHVRAHHSRLEASPQHAPHLQG
jgi:hypothetical protein